MSLKQITFASLLACVLLVTAAAQDSNSTRAQSSSLTVTAAAASERVRITAPSSVVQMHLEVYAASGEKIFDQEIKGGNVFDWHFQNGQGERVAPGDYVCVVTAKSVSGKLTQKIGTVSVEDKLVRAHPATSQQLSALQAQAIGPVEENSSWMVTGEEEPLTPTVIAHDGTDGQMIRGRGALTFRIGSFFTGNDKEQMRLTEDGRLGIGTNDPRATLDVAGTIRAQRFLIVKSKAEAGKSAQEYLTSNATEPEEVLLTGTGTQNRLAKWIDNSGTLGDSAITETAGGFVGIGTTAPGSRLVVSSNSAPLPPATGIARFADADGVQTGVFADSFGTNPIFNVRRANGTAASPSALQADQIIGVIGASGYGASAYVGTRARVAFVASENWTNTANGTYLTFNTTANGASTAGGTERMRVASNGNVGIGTSSSQYKLHVEGGSIAAGVFGHSTVGFGVFGSSDSSWGVKGHSGSGLGVFGSTTSGFAGYFDGKVTVSGNVGIGTSEPQQRLHLNGPDSRLRIQSTLGSAYTEIKYHTDGRIWNTGVGGSTVTSAVNGKYYIYDETAGQFRLIIDTEGRVGIGTFFPIAKLEVYATSHGVYSRSTNGTAVRGSAVNLSGVYGSSETGDGVRGFSESGSGVVTQSTSGNLVEGYSTPTFRRFHITNTGTYVTGSDFAEALPATGDRATYEPGDVLVVSTKAPGKVEKASRAYDVRVAGIYSTRPGMLGAEKNGTSRVDPEDVPVAIVGIVPTKVSALNGSIRVGDLLTTSDTPGYAMRCANRVKCVGAIVGKALEPLAKGKGVIKVLVMLR